MKKKTLITVHSQKGGVGKTLISLYLARRMAEDIGTGVKTEKGLGTVLIDADLTGTSFVDFLPFSARKDDGTLYGPAETKELIKKRTDNKSNNIRELHFLNDYLQCTPPAYNNYKANKKLHQLLWKSSSDNFPQKLSVIPSSGCVDDVQRTLLNIFREDITGFIRSRMSELCIAIDEENDVIVIDSPPVLHGISKVILQLHSELEKKEKRNHLCIFVCVPDIQGTAGTLRYIDRFLTESTDSKEEAFLEEKWIRMVLNQYPQGELRTLNIILNNRPKICEYLSNELIKIVEPKKFDLPKFFEPPTTIFNDHDNELAKSFLDYSYLSSRVDSLEVLVKQIKDEVVNASA
jgi:cellulose biosynthesis protein BcsQ